jgi:hypothetical protein
MTNEHPGKVQWGCQITGSRKFQSREASRPALNQLIVEVGLLAASAGGYWAQLDDERLCRTFGTLPKDSSLAFGTEGLPTNSGTGNFFEINQLRCRTSPATLASQMPSFRSLC